MIAASGHTHQFPQPIAPEAGWQRELAAAIRDPAELLARVGLPAQAAAAALATRHAADRFALRVPHAYVARIRRGDPDDPLLRQVLPLADELARVPGYGADPVGDLGAARGHGLLQKYRGRVLLVGTGACAVHCRYCFRREFPYPEQQASADRWRGALELIRADASIHEVILSGGDPWTLADAKLAALTDALATIPHVRRLRVHTRLPIVLPARVDAGLLDWLRGLRWPVTVVVHANHAQELDVAVAAAVARLREAGATLLNQSVLLRGVNDDVAALAALSERLHDIGVLPYYLHLLDPVSGAAHFDVPEAQARHLHGELAARLPGYLVPRLVRDLPGASAKVSISSESACRDGC